MGQTVNVDGHPVAVNTAKAFEALAADFKKVSGGYTLHVTDGLRNYAQQKELYEDYRAGRGPLAANPDVPNAARHISGHALDVHDSGSDAGVTVIGSKRHNQLKSILGKHGFSPTGDSFSPPEGWHIDFGGDPYGTSGGGKTPQQVIKDEQSWLNSCMHAGLTVDGVQGPATTAAFKKYQEFLKKDWGYTGAIDGVWGPGTQAAHQKYYNWSKANAAKQSSNVLRSGSKGSAVKALQSELNRIFPSYSKLKVDSDYGPATEGVVKEFQKRAGLTVDGIAGANTLAKLRTYGAKV